MLELSHIRQYVSTELKQTLLDNIFLRVKGKDKVIPLQGRCGPEGG